MEISAKMSEKQVRVLLTALDLLSRIGAGQMDTIDIAMRSIGVSASIDQHADVERTLRELKRIYFPDMPANGSHGIFSPETPDDSKIAYDMIQVLRNKLAWYSKPNGGYTVDFQDPMQSFNGEKLIEAYIDGDDEILTTGQMLDRLQIGEEALCVKDGPVGDKVTRVIPGITDHSEVVWIGTGNVFKMGGFMFEAKWRILKNSECKR